MCNGDNGADGATMMVVLLGDDGGVFVGWGGDGVDYNDEVTFLGHKL